MLYLPVFSHIVTLPKCWTSTDSPVGQMDLLQEDCPQQLRNSLSSVEGEH